MENRAFEASEGMTFVRKSDNARFGHFISFNNRLNR